MDLGHEAGPGFLVSCQHPFPPPPRVARHEVWVAVLVQVHISKRVGPGGALWAGWRPHSIRWVTEDGF